jgi:general nucleoside transport system permease protein
MAAPSAPPVTQKSFVPPMFAAWLRQAGRALGAPLGSILFAFVAGAVVILITGGNPVQAYQSLICGGVGLFCFNGEDPSYQISQTIVFTIPLIFTGLSVAFAFRSGLFNIGAEGQLIMGAIAATVVGLHFASAPAFLLLPAVLVAGTLAGALWAGIVGVLKAWTGAHEVVTTIMLNYVAQFFLEYLIVGGPLQGKNQFSSSPPIGAGAQLPLLPGQTYGGVHAGLFLAIIAAIVFSFIMRRTTLGYEIRAVGQSQRAARYAGVSVKRTIIISMLISGAFAGLAGAVQIAGLRYQLTDSYKPDTTGFDAIAVSLLGQNAAIGVVLAAILFGALHAGGTIMQGDAGISANLILVLQGLILFSIAANFLRTVRVRIPGLSKAPESPLEEPQVSATVAGEPEGVTAADAGGSA